MCPTLISPSKAPYGMNENQKCLKTNSIVVVKVEHKAKSSCGTFRTQFCWHFVSRFLQVNLKLFFVKLLSDFPKRIFDGGTLPHEAKSCWFPSRWRSSARLYFWKDGKDKNWKLWPLIKVQHHKKVMLYKYFLLNVILTTL